MNSFIFNIESDMEHGKRLHTSLRTYTADDRVRRRFIVLYKNKDHSSQNGGGNGGGTVGSKRSKYIGNLLGGEIL